MTGLVAPEGLEGRRGDGTVHPLVNAWALVQCHFYAWMTLVAQRKGGPRRAPRTNIAPRCAWRGRPMGSVAAFPGLCSR